ncbi:MAG: GNAT family N-acetyltransferase [Acidimicrobiales bacterium]
MIHIAAGDELDAPTLYQLLRLRAEVFVVEQNCPYMDPDGRDLDPSTRHIWVEEEGTIIATARIAAQPDGTQRIGRVVTASSARGRGLAADLVRTAVEQCDTSPIALDAQSQLVDWYRSLGFAVAGDDFIEDGIRHTPMRYG